MKREKKGKDTFTGMCGFVKITTWNEKKKKIANDLCDLFNNESLRSAITPLFL